MLQFTESDGFNDLIPKRFAMLNVSKCEREILLGPAMIGMRYCIIIGYMARPSIPYPESPTDELRDTPWMV
jgi:hypothetical protein